MLLKTELEQWLSTLAADDYVAIDEGGLALLSVRSHYLHTPPLEVGGVPEDVCAVAPECRHEPDMDSATVNTSGSTRYLDVRCKYCESRGCIHTLNSEDVDW